MPLVKPRADPGFLSQATQVQAIGGWYAGNLVRWRLGLLEKMGGWQRLFQDALPSIIRRLHAWLDLDNRKNLLIATDTGVHLAVQDTVYALVSERGLQGGFFPTGGATGNVTSFSVASLATTVTVNTSTVVSVGDRFFVRIPFSIGGRIIPAATSYTVKGIVAGGFTFDMPLPAFGAES